MHEDLNFAMTLSDGTEIFVESRDRNYDGDFFYYHVVGRENYKMRAYYGANGKTSMKISEEYWRKEDMWREYFPKSVAESAAYFAKGRHATYTELLAYINEHKNELADQYRAFIRFNDDNYKHGYFHCHCGLDTAYLSEGKYNGFVFRPFTKEDKEEYADRPDADRDATWPEISESMEKILATHKNLVPEIRVLLNGTLYPCRLKWHSIYMLCLEPLKAENIQEEKENDKNRI